MSMTVGQVMTRPVLATTANTSVRDIALQLVAAGISGLPVADRDGTVVGVVTEHDVVEALMTGKPLDSLKASDIMAKPAITLDVGANLNESLRIFKEKTHYSGAHYGGGQAGWYSVPDRRTPGCSGGTGVPDVLSPR
jgi:predicted transcriptional regulator